jgi:hypothetical protein
MDLKVLPPPTVLASPVVSPEDLETKTLIYVFSEHQSRRLWTDRGHETLSLTCCMKACFSETGKNLKNLSMDCNRISGLPFSKFAPARKSAQIISRQYPRDLSVPGIRAAVSRRLLDHRNLALIDFELNDLMRFHLPTGQILLHLSLELLFRHRPCLLQPGCTIKLLTLHSRHFRWF